MIFKSLNHKLIEIMLMKICTIYIPDKKLTYGVEEMSQGLGSLAVLLEDLGLVSSTCMVAHNCLLL